MVRVTFRLTQKVQVIKGIRQLSCHEILVKVQCIYKVVSKKGNEDWNAYSNKASKTYASCGIQRTDLLEYHQ